MKDPEAWRVFLSGMATGGALVLVVIRAEMWWNDRGKK